MNIYLIRHGEAERSSSGTGDFERKLTKEGKLQVRLSAEKWKSVIKSFDYIISSPLTRAVQTAKIIAEVFDYNEEIIKDDRLSSGGTTEGLIQIAESLDGDDFAFIGHQPDMSQHVSTLISNSGAHVEFKKAAIAKISFHNRVQVSRGELEFLIPPQVFK